MQRLFKRTLAFMLVVCMLLGTMVMPTFATDTATEETTAVTYTYDFTQLSNTTGTYNKTTEDVFWGMSSALYYGFGNVNHIYASNHQQRVLDSFYNDGNFTWTYTKDGEETEYSTDIDLNWRVLAAKSSVVEDYTVTYEDGTVAKADLICDYVSQGGYYLTNYEKNATSAMGYNGISYFHRELDESTYNKNDDDSFKSFAYTDLPGGWVAVKIKAPAVGAYNVEMGYTTYKNGAKKASVWIVPGVVSDSTEIEEIIAGDSGKLSGTVNFYSSGNSYIPGNSADLGNIAIDHFVEEYTVIITTDQNASGTTEAGYARTFIDSLTFTSAEAEVQSANTSKTYSFNLDSYVDDGTLNKKGATYASLRDADNRAALSTLYDTLDWDYVDDTFSAADANVQIRDPYLYFLGAGTATAPRYIAMKIKSPGTGNFQINYTSWQMESCGSTASDGYTYEYQSPLWMDMYILKLEEGMDPTASDSHEYLFDYAEHVGLYDPAYANNRNTTATRKVTDSIGAYAFEEGAEYIVYMRRANETGMDTTKDQTDGDDYWMPNNFYPISIDVTPLGNTVASIGEDANREDLTLGYGIAASSTLYTYLESLRTSTDPIYYTDGTAIAADDTTTAVPEAPVVAFNTLSTTTMRYYRYNLGGGSITQNQPLANKQAELYNLKDGRQKFLTLGFTGGNYNIRHDANQMIIDTDKKNAFAMEFEAPGAGEYKISLQGRTGSGDSGWKYTDSETGDTKYYANAPVWLNIYLVKVSDTINASTFADAYTNSKSTFSAAQYTPEFVSYGDSSGHTLDYMYLQNMDGSGDFTFDFEEGAKYILYIERHKDADNSKSDGNLNYSASSAYLYGFKFESLGETTEKAEYTTLTAALDAAQPGDTITLHSDVLLGNIILPDDVTLDLNGHTVTTSGFATSPNGEEAGAITDSSNGAGALKVLRDNASFLGDGALSGNVIPMYDAEHLSYRFYEYSYNGWGAEDDILSKGGVDGAIRFWYQLQFTNKDAYTLLASNTTGVYMGAEFDYDRNHDSRLFANSTEASVTNDAEAWAAAYGEYAGGLAEGKSPWLWVRVLNAADADGLTVTPYITAGGVEIALAPMTYNVVAD